MRSGLEAPSQARQWGWWVRAHLDPQRADDALLMLTEVVTNAVLHSGIATGEPIHLTGRVADDQVRIGVCDCGRGFDLAGPPGLPRHDTAGGRGLWIVNRLADRVLVDGSRGRVVFELSSAGARMGNASR